MRMTKRNEDSRKRAAGHDRGSGTIRDGYVSDEDFEQLSRYFYTKNTETGLRNRLVSP
jgi:hypothetical protein